MNNNKNHKAWGRGKTKPKQTKKSKPPYTNSQIKQASQPKELKCIQNHLLFLEPTTDWPLNSKFNKEMINNGEISMQL